MQELQEFLRVLDYRKWLWKYDLADHWALNYSCSCAGADCWKCWAGGSGNKLFLLTNEECRSDWAGGGCGAKIFTIQQKQHYHWVIGSVQPHMLGCNKLHDARQHKIRQRLTQVGQGWTSLETSMVLRGGGGGGGGGYGGRACRGTSSLFAFNQASCL